MTIRLGASAVLLALGALFLLAGTVGLLRFPDAYARLHALTKADNLGLGLIVFGLAVNAESPAVAAKLGLIWLVALFASASSCYLTSGVVDAPGGDGSDAA